MQETRVRFLGGEDPLENEMATHSSITPGESHGQRGQVDYTVQRVPKSQTWLSDWAHTQKKTGRKECTHVSTFMPMSIISTFTERERSKPGRNSRFGNSSQTLQSPYSRMERQRVSLLLVSDSFWFFFNRSFFWLWHRACRILVPPPGVEPMPPAMDTLSPNQWATREMPSLQFHSRS